MTPIPITIVSRKLTSRGEFICWSDGLASRHVGESDEWCSQEEARNPMAKQFGKGEQVGMFATGVSP